MKIFKTIRDKIAGFVRAVKKGAVSFIKNAPAVILVIAAAVTVTGVCNYVMLRRSRPELRTSEVWSQGSDVSFRHVAVYPKKEFGRGDVDSVRKSLQGIVDTSAGIRRKKSDKAIDPEGWVDCYCAFAAASLFVEHNGQDMDGEADVYAVGGDFKAFHPMEFLAGGFLPVKAVDKYQIVLNDELCWKFFSSYDVIGAKVTLLDKEYTVTGVVREHDDLKFRAYVYYDSLNEPGSIRSYEAMIPEQIKGAAMMDVRNSLPGYDMSSPEHYVVSVTGRYGIGSVIDNMLPPGETSAMLSDYDLPFWEMSAQKVTSEMFMWVVITGVGCIIILVTSIVLLREIPVKKSGRI